MPARLRVVGAVALVAALLLGVIAAAPAAPAALPVDEPTLVPAPELLPQPRAAVPEDRYAMAGGCYAVRSLVSDQPITRRDGNFTLGAADAEPFHFQATDLGRYLLYGTADDFLAAETGPAEQVQEALQPVFDRSPIQPGTNLPRSIDDDLPADPSLTFDVPLPSTIGTNVVAAGAPSPAADWSVEQLADGAFVLTLPATGGVLTAAADGSLALSDTLGEGARFALALTEGCADWPEVEINVDGVPVKGETPFAEVRGYLEGHLHTMAYEFLGGRVRCGRPWHPYGVEYAMVDCPDHEPGGYGAVLEGIVSHGSPDGRHDTVGWPTFNDWPAHDSLTHEGVYYRWLERAWRGGQRMLVTLLVDNNGLCSAWPLKRNSCNEMDGVRLQAMRLRQFQDYIDAQSGGPGEGWLRIVTDPFEAREVVNQGKLAVIMGIEVSVLFDCGEYLGVDRCTDEQIDERLAEVQELGVRQMEFVNKFDNALSGVTGDSGLTGPVVNLGNREETGHFWQMTACEEDEGHDVHAHDKQQPNLVDDGEQVGEVVRDAMVGAILQMFGETGAAPTYGPGPHCNAMGLGERGAYLLGRMMEEGLIFDPDHMSAKGRRQALDIVQEAGYSGVFSSHSWADDTIYPRVYRSGGTITPHAGSSSGFVNKWRQHVQWADDRFEFGIGFGSDMNGFSTQGGPPRRAANAVQYPFEGFGGVVIDQQVSGEREYHINDDGVAHYGLYPDWIEDLRMIAGDAIVADLERGPEAYLQMWERALGIANDACREGSGVPRQQLKRVRKGMSVEDVLFTAGQPASRIGHEFRYCMLDNKGGLGGATVHFDDDGRVISVDLGKSKPGKRGGPTPKSGGDAPAVSGGDGYDDDHDHVHEVAQATTPAAAPGTLADGLRLSLLLAGLGCVTALALRRRLLRG